MKILEKSNMKYKINVFPRTFTFKKPARTSRGVYTHRQSWFVTVAYPETPDDIKGVGECAPLPDLSCDYTPDYEKKLRSICDKLELQGKLEDIDLQDYPSMRFGIESALAQVKAGSADIFETPFSRGEKGIPFNGLVWMDNYENMFAQMEEKIDKGFRCVKLKVGAIDFDSELSLVKHIRSRFSASVIEIRLDANGGFTPDDALYKLELLSQYSIHSIEQPIKPHQWSYMAQLCRESPLPIALDEELIGINDPSMMAYMLNIIKPAYLVLKPSLHGGISGVKQWIAAAQEKGIKTWITSALESNVGLYAIAQLAAHMYGPNIMMPQGLGTGLLFTDNIDMPIETRGDEMWRKM